MKIAIEMSSVDDVIQWQEMTATDDVGGKAELSVHDCWDSPEDATLRRAIPSCQRVAELMLFAYEAGRRGEGFEITEEVMDG